MHAGLIPPYRIGIYNYLHGFLKKQDYHLIVITEGKQSGYAHRIEYPEITIKFSLTSLIKISRNNKQGVFILFINHREKYFFPFLFYLRLSGKKIITWTHGIDLQNKYSLISRLAHHLEHSLCHRIILYSDQLKGHLLRMHRKKAYVANNTLNLLDFKPDLFDRMETLKKYGIKTEKNIIYCGRISKRKRVEDLLAAFEIIEKENKNIGLVIIGPDEEKILSGRLGQNPKIHYLGPIYGLPVIEILAACDVSCIPGAVGLGIVDAMYCGLPIITENVEHGPEIMYLKDKTNGFIVPRGDIRSLATKLRLLIENEELRKNMGEKARKEILQNASIDKLGRGFLECLNSIEWKN